MIGPHIAPTRFGRRQSLPTTLAAAREWPDLTDRWQVSGRDWRSSRSLAIASRRGQRPHAGTMPAVAIELPHVAALVAAYEHMSEFDRRFLKDTVATLSSESFDASDKRAARLI